MAVLALAFPERAQAQEGFSLNRYTPSERGSDWFANDSLDFRGQGRFALGGVLDWANKPLVLYDAGGDEVAAVVDQQLFLHVGAAVNLIDRIRFAANLPILMSTTGEGGIVNGQEFQTEEGAALGDAHLSADLRLLGEYGGPLSFAVGAQVFLPTGDQASYTGDGKVRFRPRLAAAGDLGVFAYAANAGFNLRARDGDFAGEPFGNELTLAGALGVRAFDKRLLIGGEIWGSTVLKDEAAFERRTTPFEVAFGGKYKAADAWHLGAAVGPGITRGVGSPKLRVLVSLTWFPEIEEPREPPPPPPAAEPSDRDGDGIVDDDDRCPDEAGLPNQQEPEKHGCPKPGDRDGDGIIDDVDACPDERGVESKDPKKHGCPLPSDRDADGIIDDEDSCPDEAGIESELKQYHGCPDPDSDRDGVLIPDDACPDVAGVKDADPKKNGCPKAKVVKGRIEILERVEFATASADIQPESFGVLSSVLRILKDNPTIELVSIEGHTDNRGRNAYNRRLSSRRAKAVMIWLTERGVAASRLLAKGFGPDRPLDTNATAAGRQNNRRVEFHIKRGGLEDEDGRVIDLDKE